MSNVPGLALYQYMSCPYCARVRAAMESLGVEIELRDTRMNPDFSDEVFAATGRPTVPVLRIESEDGSVEWLPESLDIIAYLQNRFA